jgi:hypothetical protein
MSPTSRCGAIPRPMSPAALRRSAWTASARRSPPA